MSVKKQTRKNGGGVKKKKILVNDIPADQSDCETHNETVRPASQTNFEERFKAYLTLNGQIARPPGYGRIPRIVWHGEEGGMQSQ